VTGLADHINAGSWMLLANMVLPKFELFAVVTPELP